MSTKTVYNIFSGQNNNFIGIWSDITSGRNNGRMYVSTTGNSAVFSVVDLTNKVLYDEYTVNKEGLFDEKLDREDIIDINTSSAV